MNTNAIPVIQTIAQHAGYTFSTCEVAAWCALAGGSVHYLHIVVSAYGRAGGWQGIWRFIKTGKTTP